MVEIIFVALVLWTVLALLADVNRRKKATHAAECKRINDEFLASRNAVYEKLAERKN